MTSRPRSRRAPLIVLVVAVFALLSSVLWVTATAVGPGATRAEDGEFAYLTHMVAHHQEAIDAARQLERSGRAEIRTLGASIVTTQTAEITTMNAWLAAWYPGRSTAVAYQPMMRDLSTLSGDALDRTFLQDMIPHHMMAVMASQQLLMNGRVQHQELIGFARTVRDAQHTEILQMQGYLAAWFGGGWRMHNGSWDVPGGSSMPCGASRR